MNNTEKYPLIKCEHPRVIITPSGKEVLVPCGHCKACMMRKQANYTQQVRLEALRHKYCLFITLTYSNKNVPRLVPIEVFPDYYNLCIRNKKGKITDEILDSFYMKSTDMNFLRNKFNISGDVPYLRKNDLQKFFDNLRIKLNREYAKKTKKHRWNKNGKEEKLRYFAIGEFGPVHYRPHYHILLWFEREETYEKLLQIIPKVWKFGRIDCQRTFGKSINYVTGYLNSYNLIPSILRKNEIGPFNLHSTRLGQYETELLGDKIYESPDRNSLCTRYNSNGKFRTTVPWSTLKTRYFPKCLHYSELSLQSKYDAYRCYNVAKDVIGYENPTELSKIILDALIDMNKKYMDNTLPTDLNCYNLGIDYKRFFEWFGFIATDGHYHLLRTLKLGEYENTTKDLYNKARGRIYRTLLLSKTFISKICKNDSNLLMSRVKAIDAYYNDCELETLRQFYEFQEKHPEYTEIMYNETFSLDLLAKTDIYNKMLMDTDEFAYNSIKHKELNDKNKIFNKL